MTSPPDPVPTLPGYEIDRVVGRGARGVVVAGADPDGHPVAVKVVRPQADDVERLQAQLERHVLEAVRHPHLVPLRAVGATDDGRLALVFDLVDGAPLARVVGARGHLTPGEVVTVLTPLCGAVEALHAAGVTHGDISPGNVLLTGDGRPLLADLGSSHLAGAGAGAVDGTPGFFAPEVLEGERPGPASDVHSLGAIGWYCLTGEAPEQRPFGLGRETVVERLGAPLGPALAAALAPDPAERPSAAELARLVWAAAPPRPLEVVVSTDAATALTHRLRLEAERALAEAEASAGRSRGVTRRWAPTRLVSRRTGIGIAVMAATWIALVGVLGALGADGRPSAPGLTGVRTVLGQGAAPGPWPSGGPSDPAGTRPPWSGAEVLADPLAPERDPTELLQELSTRRAALLVTGDGSLLASVHVAGSESDAADRALVADLDRSATRLADVELTVRDARLLERDGDRATVRARVATSAHQVLSADGTATSRPPREGQELDFGLELTEAGWRISEVRETAAS